MLTVLTICPVADGETVAVTVNVIVCPASASTVVLISPVPELSVHRLLGLQFQDTLVNSGGIMSITVILLPLVSTMLVLVIAIV